MDDAPEAGPWPEPTGAKRAEPRGELLAREPSLRPLADGSVWALSAAPVLPGFPLITTATTTQYVQSWTKYLQKSPTWGVGEVNNTLCSSTEPPTQNPTTALRFLAGIKPKVDGQSTAWELYLGIMDCNAPSGLDRASPFNPSEWAALSKDPTRACENHGQPLISRPLCA